MCVVVYKHVAQCKHLSGQVIVWDKFNGHTYRGYPIVMQKYLPLSYLPTISVLPGLSCKRNNPGILVSRAKIPVFCVAGAAPLGPEESVVPRDVL